mmetsp:Transcript_8533/g.17797  ORF Transcript_8533/g.17797 Transcript_8533/m.17797 type:complete len:360 (-) Transcript_8533:361-1440(-)
MHVIHSLLRCNALYSNHVLHRRARTCLLATSSTTMRSKEADNNNDTTWPPHSRIAEAFDHLRRNDKEIFLLDGGTGEELFRRNVPDDRKIWSATALVHPEYHSVLEDVHASFLRSGSNAITTNSYGVVPGVGFDDDQISEYTRESGRIARGAAKKHDDAGTDSSTAPAFVLGSLGPLLESYRPDKLMPRDEGVKSYELACRSLVPHVDAFLAETMSCVDESIQVVDAVANNGTGSTPTATEGQQQRSLLVSYSVDPEGNFRDGEKTSDGIRRILEHAEAQRARVRCGCSSFKLRGRCSVVFSCSFLDPASSRLISRLFLVFVFSTAFHRGRDFFFCSAGHSVQLFRTRGYRQGTGKNPR